MAGFHKGWSGSPFHTGYNADDGMDMGEASKREDGPRIGPGYLGKKVSMEVSKASPKGKSVDD